MAKKYLFDQEQTKSKLADFFRHEKADITSFGSAVNQTFEAYVFAKVIDWFKNKGFTVDVQNPSIDGQQVFRLKYSTRGAPKNYTHVLVQKGIERYQIRHQLRVSTARQRGKREYNANICCDISIILDKDLKNFKTDEAIPNDWLMAFGEVKHMSAFAELIASFIGLTHELKPKKLKRIRTKNYSTEVLPCFLYVSGYLNPTAKGIIETIENRKFDLDIYSIDRPIR
ncbi:MAG: hypothetical protein RIC06_25710 [Cyclobacteriaceae bacterium]